MFLSNTTIVNIQARINTQILREEVTLIAVHQYRGEIIARLKLNDLDVAVYLEPRTGTNVGDQIADALRWSTYYCMADIYAGRECDDEAERILAIWPKQPEAVNVTAIRPQVTPQSAQADTLAAGVAKLNEKFGGRRK